MILAALRLHDQNTRSDPLEGGATSVAFALLKGRIANRLQAPFGVLAVWCNSQRLWQSVRGHRRIDSANLQHYVIFGAKLLSSFQFFVWFCRRGEGLLFGFYRVTVPKPEKKLRKSQGEPPSRAVRAKRGGVGGGIPDSWHCVANCAFRQRTMHDNTEINADGKN